MKKSFIIIFSLITIGNISAQQGVSQAEIIQKIRDEGLNRSQVMNIAFFLTDVNGPRLANSPGYTRAANWSKDKLASWGLSNAKLEPWGEWGKGWELERSYIALKAPYYKPIVAYPKAWVKGTGGLKQAQVIILDAKDSTELQSFKGKLSGKIIIPAEEIKLNISFEKQSSRFDDESLSKMAAADTVPNIRRTGFIQNSSGGLSSSQLKAFAKAEGAIAILSASNRGKDGTLFVSGGGSYTKGSPENFTDIVIALEDYSTIQRLVKNKIPVTIELDIKVKWFTSDTRGYNVIAEIPGTHNTLKDEIVMLGGHLDSWHSSTGATDNASGCAVMMEAVRIFRTLNVSPKRTIRIALWGGEEQGLHGSRNYVRNHFTDTVNNKGNKLSEKVSVYFNLDNGTGKVRGIYLQNNIAARELFTRWLEPFHDLGASTVTVRNTGGTDHLSLDNVGIPGFQFIQDPIEYNTRTHHTNMDSYDHLLPEDLKQAATVIAAMLYNAAVGEEKVPRKLAN